LTKWGKAAAQRTSPLVSPKMKPFKHHQQNLNNRGNYYQIPPKKSQKESWFSSSWILQRESTCAAKDWIQFPQILDFCMIQIHFKCIFLIDFRCCNSLRQIPVEIGYMQKLEILNISMNQLEFLPDEIGHLQHLKELDLSRNKLKRIPRSIGLLKSLRFLFLQSNLLQEIPSEIGLLRKLETLDLSENSLKMIPEELNRSEKLKNLFVRDLPFDLSFIPVFTNQIPSLKELCARVIVRKDIKENYTSCFIEEYLQEAKVCTFCGGPFFETCQQRVRYLVRNSITIPFESKLCMDHWRTDSERIKLMFCPLPFTAPIANRILIPKRPSLVSRMRRPLNKKANNNIRKSPSLPTLTDASIYRPKDRLLRQISMSSLRLKSPSSLFP
jgi:hypothetical protein